MRRAAGLGRKSRKILVLGLGNDLLADDAAGLHVVRAIQNRLSPGDPVTVRESAQMGFALLDELVGFDEALLVDAIQTGIQAPGYVHVLDADSLRSLPVVSPHFAGVGEMLALGRCLDLTMPERVRVIAIEVADPFTFSTRMTRAIEVGFESIVTTVWGVLRESLALNDRKTGKGGRHA